VITLTLDAKYICEVAIYIVGEGYFGVDDMGEWNREIYRKIYNEMTIVLADTLDLETD
jgi:hypothetical protein